jgi:1-acyl-sn-glycerol-3-phosphate acyltransferase
MTMRWAGVSGGGVGGSVADIASIDVDSVVNQATLRLGDTLRAYHRHRVRGLRNLRKAFETDRPVLLVGNHCADIADPLMLTTAVYRDTGRVLRFIAHGGFFFKLPVIRELATGWGCVPNRSKAAADAVLRTDGALVIYPGGASEALLRSYREEPYRLKWAGRLGFIELALRHRATLLFVSAVGIDELYYQTRLPIPSLALQFTTGDANRYAGARFGLGLGGLHILPALLPLPVQVTHVISRPLVLDGDVDVWDREAVERVHADVWAACQRTLRATVGRRRRDSDRIDSLCRSVMRGFEKVGL